MEKKNKRVLMLVFIGVVLISLIAVAYAYFIATVSVPKQQEITAETGTMRLLMNDGNTGWSEVWDFGESKSKTFTLQNTGSLPVTVDLYWKNLVNTFLEGSMVYNLKQTTDTSEETYLVGSASTFENIPTSATSVSTNKIAEQITVPANKTYTYTLTIQLVNSPTVDQTADLNANFYTEFDIKEYEEPVPTGAQTLIAKANAASVTTYSSGTTTVMYTFTHSDIDTSLATQVSSWTSAELTDYRYIGANPNNYVYYNCTNPSDYSTCEKWRIIGVFTTEDKGGNKAQRIKLIRNATILGFSWNSSYVNEWVGGSLATLLNSGDYYTRSGSYASNGLTASAKSMIDEKAKYYLGGYDDINDKDGSVYYNFERGTTVYSGRSTSVIQEVGLMYPSDYVYTYANGVDSKCYTNALCCDEGTPVNGWIFNTNTAEGSTSPTEVWTVSPRSGSSYYAFIVRGTGYVDHSRGVGYPCDVRPVVYLNSDATIDPNQGDGSENNPYRLLS